MLTRRLAAVFLVLALALPRAAQAEQILSKQAFGERFVAALKAAAPGDKVVARSVEDFDVTLPDGSTGQVYLGNAYQDYLADPGSLDEVIAKFVRLTAGIGSSEKVQLGQLRVLLRPKAYTAIDPKTQDTPDKRQVSRLFAGDLYAVIGADQPEAIMFPTRGDIIDLVPGGEQDLWTLALDNTRKALGDVEVQQIDTGVLGIPAPTLAASLLMDDGFWSRPEFAGKGNLVAYALKDYLIVVHEDDAVAVAKLRRFVDEQADNAGMISQVLLVRRAGKWEVLGS